MAIGFIAKKIYLLILVIIFVLSSCSKSKTNLIVELSVKNKALPELKVSILIKSLQKKPIQVPLESDFTVTRKEDPIGDFYFEFFGNW